jgi:chromosome segregation ATPase
MPVQTFECPRCKAGAFRSLPNPDGKAFCPWCGEAVEAAAAPPVPEAVAPTSDAERIAELTRRCERAEAELARELEKKQGIKKVVSEEMGKLETRLDETKVRLRKKEEEQGASFDEILRLKGQLEAERIKVEEFAKAASLLGEKEKLIQTLRTELEPLRKVEAELRGARREAEKAAELRDKLAARDHLLSAMKGVENELAALKAKARDDRGKLDKERERAASLEAELGKRDQRIRELQALIKTLGERLNELAQRHHI